MRRKGESQEGSGRALYELRRLECLSTEELLDGGDLEAAWRCLEDFVGDQSSRRLAPAASKRRVPATSLAKRSFSGRQRKIALLRAARPSSATVFISYTQKDRGAATELAMYLEAQGVHVWWDHQLYPGDNLHDVIVNALDGASAVIVIWSNTAARSPWVRDEARRAARQGKLIPVHLPSFDPKNLPLGLGDHPLVSIQDRDRLMGRLTSDTRDFTTHS